MMWEYKIYKTSLGWGIYRKKQLGKMILLQYLNGYDLWTTNKNMAKTFYTQDSAVSALVIIKRRGETDTTSDEEDTEVKAEKQSWSEFG